MERNYFCIFRFEENVRCELANNIKKLVQRELTMRLQEGVDDAVHIFFFSFLLYYLYTFKSTKSMHLLMYHKKILNRFNFFVIFYFGLKLI